MHQAADALDPRGSVAVFDAMVLEQQRKQERRKQTFVFGGALASWDARAGLRAVESMDEKEKDEEAQGRQNADAPARPGKSSHSAQVHATAL